MGNNHIDNNFVYCEKCGKKLIERKNNGMWHFVFGKPINGDSQYIPVDMYIQGNIKIKCLRRTCGHWQMLNFFPGNFEIVERQSGEIPNKSDCA